MEPTLDAPSAKAWASVRLPVYPYHRLGPSPHCSSRTSRRCTRLIRSSKWGLGGVSLDATVLEGLWGVVAWGGGLKWISRVRPEGNGLLNGPSVMNKKTKDRHSLRRRYPHSESSGLEGFFCMEVPS